MSRGSRIRGGELLLLTLFLGLGYGLAEAVIVLVFSLIPGALAWRTGNSAPVLLAAPAFYAVAYLPIGFLAVGLNRLIPRVPWDEVLVALLGALSGYLAASLQGGIFSPLAALLLGLGTGAVLTRIYRRVHAPLRAHRGRVLLALTGIPLLAGGAALGLQAGRERAAMKRLPAPRREAVNVLLLVMDTQRADHLSTYGYSRPTSPSIEALAREGIVFRHAMAPSSWTLPSHAGMMTGRRNDEHRAGIQGRPYLDRRYLTLAEALTREGYAAGGFVSNTFWAGRQTRIHRGFIRYEDFYGNLGDAVSRTSLGRLLAYEVAPRFGWRDIPGRKRAAVINRDFLDWQATLGGRPFFAFLNYMDVHGPYLPRPPYLGRFRPHAPVRGATTIELGAVDDETKPPPPEQLALWVDRYDEAILELDAAIGALLAQLRERQLLERTLIILTSDHGEAFGEHGMIYHGGSLYPEQIHVPLLLRLPGGSARGTVIDSPVSLIQIPATVMAVTGRAVKNFPGRSLLDAGAPGAVVSEVWFRPLVPATWPSARGGLRTLITPQWQFIRHDDGTLELYDRVNDPGSTRNLSNDPGHAAALATLRTGLDSIQALTPR